MSKINKKSWSFFAWSIYIILAIIIIATTAYISRYYYDMYLARQQSKLLDNISIDENNITNGEFLSTDNSSEDNSVQDILIIGNSSSEISSDENSNNTINDTTTPKTERMLKIKELQKENSDIIGWIEIENTNINYPVLQGTDNSFYVSHNYKKQKNISGAIFLDKDYVWDPPSSNLLIYGHNNQNGTMFEDLLKYRYKSFYEQHPVIRFTTNNEDAYYEIISAFPSQVYYKSQTDVFKYYYFVNASNEKEFYEYVRNAKNASLYDTGKTAEYGDQLMTLSTCAYHTTDGRFVVVARKIG